MRDGNVTVRLKSKWITKESKSLWYFTIAIDLIYYLVFICLVNFLIKYIVSLICCVQGGGVNGGGLSPGKLRNMLLGMGVDKKRKEEEKEIESDNDNCKDVDVVSVVPEPQCSTLSNSQQRLPIAPFSKPAPSKWDDAQKWIASPNWHRPRNQVTGVRKGGVSRQSSTKVLEGQTDQTLLEEPHTKRIDLHLDQPRNFVPFEAHSYANPVLMIENSVAQSAGKDCANCFTIFLHFDIISCFYDLVIYIIEFHFQGEYEDLHR